MNVEQEERKFAAIRTTAAPCDFISQSINKKWDRAISEFQLIRLKSVEQFSDKESLKIYIEKLLLGICK